MAVDYSTLTPAQIADLYRQLVQSGQVSEAQFVQMAQDAGIPNSSLLAAQTMLLAPAQAPAATPAPPPEVTQAPAAPAPAESGIATIDTTAAPTEAPAASPASDTANDDTANNQMFSAPVDALLRASYGTPKFEEYVAILSEFPELDEAIQNVLNITGESPQDVGYMLGYLYKENKYHFKDKDATLKNYYDQIARRYESNPRDPKYRELMQLVRPKVDDDTFYEKIREKPVGSQGGSLVAQYRDPSTGYGIGVELNPRGVPARLSYFDPSGTRLRSSNFSAPELYARAEEFGIDLSGIGTLGQQLEQKNIGYRPYELYRGTGSDHGLNFDDIAEGGLGTAFDWTKDENVALKGPTAPKTLADNQALATRLGLVKNPGVTTESGISLSALRPFSGPGGTRNFVAYSKGATSWHRTREEAEAETRRRPGSTVLDLSHLPPIDRSARTNPSGIAQVASQTGAPNTRTAQTMTPPTGQFNQGVYDYVAANINNPRAIYDRMRELNATPATLAAALGIPETQVNQYFSNAGINTSGGDSRVGDTGDDDTVDDDAGGNRIDYSRLTPEQIAAYYRQYVESGQYTEQQFVDLARELEIPDSSLTAARTLLLGRTGTRPGVNTEAIDPSQSTLSPNFADYVYNMLGRAEQAASLPYQPYTGERFAGPSDLQTQAFNAYQNMMAPSQFGEATGIARLAAEYAAGTRYSPTDFSAERITPSQLTQYQMGSPERVAAERAQAAQLGAAPMASAQQFGVPERAGFERVGAERVAAPQLRDLYMQAAAPVSAQLVGSRDIEAAQTGFRPDLQQYQMEAPDERVTSESFITPGTAESYMSPYMQRVVDARTREAIRQADIARGTRGARFAQAGAYGGARQAVEEAEAERNLQTQLGDIQATGLQSAFEQAQAQFNREQQAQQAAQQANIGTGLTVGQQNLAAQLGVQQLGTQAGLQTALANLTNEQQARVQNEASRLQAAGMNQQQALQAALANQGVTQQANLQNLSAALQTQGLQSQTGMEAQRLNQASGLQALLANQQAGMQTGQFNAQQAYNAAMQNAQMRQQAELANQQMLGQYGLQQGQFQQAANMLYPQQALQAALANQQMGYNTGAQNLAALLGVQQLGSQQNLAAQQYNQQAGLDAQRLAEQSRQFGAGYGMQGLGQLINAGQLMGSIGSQAGQYGLQGMRDMLSAGATQQQLNQQPYDFGYQQWQESLKYPYQQASFMSTMLGGLPLQARAYDSGTSGLGGLLSGLATGVGLTSLLNR